MWLCVNTLATAVIPNLNVLAAVPNPPEVVKKGTSLIPKPELGSAVAILKLPAVEPAGNVTPEDEIAIAPVPSPEIVAPFKSIVLPDKYISLHLNDDVPKSYVIFVSGIKWLPILALNVTESLEDEPKVGLAPIPTVNVSPLTVDETPCEPVSPATVRVSPKSTALVVPLSAATEIVEFVNSVLSIVPNVIDVTAVPSLFVKGK